MSEVLTVLSQNRNFNAIYTFRNVLSNGSCQDLFLCGANYHINSFNWTLISLGRQWLCVFLKLGISKLMTCTKNNACFLFMQDSAYCIPSQKPFLNRSWRYKYLSDTNQVIIFELGKVFTFPEFLVHGWCFALHTRPIVSSQCIHICDNYYKMAFLWGEVNL